MERLLTGSAIDANAACRGGNQKTRHETGVVSRVPRSSRSAQAFGTDRNTYQKLNTPTTTTQTTPRGNRRKPDKEAARRECETLTTN